jgi:HD-GYP domain-containing protein (c-di-GMP phosphodiesterase class II)
VYIVSAVGIAMLACLFPFPLETRTLIGFGVFAFLSFISEMFPVDVGVESSESVAIAFHVGAIVLYGPGVAQWVAAIGSGLVDIVDRKPIHKLLFNIGQYAICVGGSGLVYRAMAARMASDALESSRIDLIQLFPALIVMILTYLLLNVTLVSVVVALSLGLSPLDLWGVSYRGTLFQYFALGPMGILVALVYQQQPIGIVLLALPVVLARMALKNYIQLISETKQTLEILADVIDKRDRYTFQHSKRVSKYAVEVARRLGLSESDVQLIDSAARVHDLGKIVIADDILQKPGKLTPAEFGSVKTHPVEGSRIVKNLSLYQKGLNFILYHHEKYDGSGYPEGLRGNAIPLGARIICVADSFDAMTTDRPYRPAMPVESAIRELSSCAGTHFDPEIVKVFISYLEETREFVHEVAVSKEP